MPPDADATIYHVQIARDRRRAVLVTPDVKARFLIATQGAESLRLSLGRVEPTRATAISDLRIRIEVTTTQPAQSSSTVLWEATLPADERGWLDLDLELAALFAAARSRFEISVTRVSAGGGGLALATPRLVKRVPEPLLDRRAANVMIYLADTLRPDHMSLYGYARATTPVADRLAGDGIAFDAAYSTAAWTRPATASLLTSLYPSAHGANAGQTLADSVDTLAERFRRAGWSTLAVVANANVGEPELGFAQGFDRFILCSGADAGFVHAQLKPHLLALRDEPLFVYIHTIDPHSPYGAPEPFRHHFTDPDYAGPIRPQQTGKRALRKLDPVSPDDLEQVVALYDGEIRYQDHALGELMADLKELGLAERLLLVFTSDHGEELLEHGDWGHGRRVYEEQIRIPLWLWGRPVAHLAGSRIGSAVQIVDLMPTLLSWFGLSRCDRCDGVDLTHLLEASGGSASPCLTDGRVSC